jgi:hypothetical protein
MCYKYINLHIKCNVSSTCNILNLSCVQEYVGGLGQLFCFPRKNVEFPINFCLVYIVACQNATILLAGVGGPRDPTIARGTIRSLLQTAGASR